MTSIDEIWASMNEDSIPSRNKVDSNQSNIQKKKTKKKSNKLKSNNNDNNKNNNYNDNNVIDEKKDSSVVDEFHLNNDDKDSSISCISNNNNNNTNKTIIKIDYITMINKLNKDIHNCNDNNINICKNSLLNINKILFHQNYIMNNDNDYNELFYEICKKIFKNFNHSYEKCREISLQICLNFFQYITNFVPILSYYFPVLLQRLPSSGNNYFYDEDMKIFVNNLEQHDAHRRGRAVDRQDKIGTIGMMMMMIIPSSL